MSLRFEETWGFSRPPVGCSEPEICRRVNTASVEVRYSMYPLPREMNIACGSVWPRLASKLRGSLPYSAATLARDFSGCSIKDGTVADGTLAGGVSLIRSVAEGD